MQMLSVTHIHWETLILQSFNDFIHIQVSTMDALQYWPFAQEYFKWNSSIAALQFWMADLKLHILSNAIDWVYAAFFYSDFTQQIQHLPEEILFGHSVTILSDAFETELTQKDEVYESRSENFNISTLLSRALRICHISAREDFSLNPSHFGESPTTLVHHEETSPCWYSHCNFTSHWLVFTSSNDKSSVRLWHSSTNARSPGSRRAELSSLMHQNLYHPVTPTSTRDLFLTDAWDNDTTFSEKSFQTAPLDDEV